MIFYRQHHPNGDFLIVCGSLWPGAHDGAPMPHGWPDHWRPDQPGHHAPDAPCPADLAAKED